MEIKIVYQSDNTLRAGSNQAGITVSIPKKVKTDTGAPAVMGPLDVFLASLGTCVGVYTVRYCEGAHIDPTGLEITVSAQLGTQKPIRFETIQISLRLPQDIGERKGALLEFVKNCPVHNTLEGNPHIEFVI